MHREIYIHIHIYIHVYIYVYTYVRTYIRTYVQANYLQALVDSNNFLRVGRAAQAMQGESTASPAVPGNAAGSIQVLRPAMDCPHIGMSLSISAPCFYWPLSHSWSWQGSNIVRLG